MKSIKKITASDSKYFHGYLNKLDKYINFYHGSVGKKPICADYYFALIEKIKANLKSRKFKVGDRVRVRIGD